MYTYPSAVINFVTYTALRWGQFPTITYSTATPAGHDAITAGNELVVIADDLSDITIYIEDGVSTNAQIKAAILADDSTVNSLYARDLISVAIDSGKESEVNTAVSATPLASADNVPPPVEPATASVEILAADPLNPTEGQVWYNKTTHLLKFFDGTDIKTVATV